jgi:hypothetical protein
MMSQQTIDWSWLAQWHGDNPDRGSSLSCANRDGDGAHAISDRLDQ